MRNLVFRLVSAIPVLILVSVMVFSLLHLLPGDPATAILGNEASPEAIAALNEKLGMNKPIIVQYGDWVYNLFHGNLGNSMVDNTPVTKLIAQRLPATLELTVGAFVVAIIIALPSGILSAARPGTWIDHVCTFISMLGMSIPHFWLGMMMILFFAVKLGLLPASGYVPLTQDPIANMEAMIMPMIATGFRQSAVLMRMVRSSMLDVMNADYIRTAVAKGLSERAVLVGQALRNAMIPVVTTSGLLIASLLGGLVITETIFSIPGFGKLMIDSVFRRDFTTVQGSILIVAVFVIIVNIIVDVLYTFIDPRIKLDKEDK
jgi:peptide/nickel transport system permease protein